MTKSAGIVKDMAVPTKEILESEWFAAMMREALAKPFRLEWLRSEWPRVPVAIEFSCSTDRAFKICECRHFVDYCDHIWQTDWRNIKYELRPRAGNRRFDLAVEAAQTFTTLYP